MPGQSAEGGNRLPAGTSRAGTLFLVRPGSDSATTARSAAFLSRQMRSSLLEQIRHVRGRVQERITAAFEELGFVDQERRKLGERRWARRVEGAEKLARMMSRAPLPDPRSCTHFSPTG